MAWFCACLEAFWIIWSAREWKHHSWKPYFLSLFQDRVISPDWTFSLSHDKLRNDTFGTTFSWPKMTETNVIAADSNSCVTWNLDNFVIGALTWRLISPKDPNIVASSILLNRICIEQTSQTLILLSWFVWVLYLLQFTFKVFHFLGSTVSTLKRLSSTTLGNFLASQTDTQATRPSWMISDHCTQLDESSPRLHRWIVYTSALSNPICLLGLSDQLVRSKRFQNKHFKKTTRVV